MRSASPLFFSIFALSCAGAPSPEPPKQPAPPTVATPTSPATAAPAEPKAPPFLVTRVMIPMRDGVKLETVILTPKGATKPLPILFKRTPYGVPSDEDIAKPRPSGPIDADGYIRVFQNLRGRFHSEGTFIMFRPQRDRKEPRAIDESADAYDTIEWLLHNVPSHNGRVGMWGTSVQVQSTWFPVYDRNPQKYADSIFAAREADYVKATQRISRAAPSSLILPILQR